MKTFFLKSGHSEGNVLVKRITDSQIWKYRQLYVLLLPTILFYICFSYLPMFGNIIAFQKFSLAKGFFESEFVGFDHFRNFLSDYNFWRLMRNTLSVSGYSLIFGFPAPIIFALLLNEVRSDKFKRTIQTVTYMPHFISIVIVSSLTLSYVSSDGLINTIRKFLGYDTIPFMSEAKYFYPVYIISGIWQNLGWNSIIYLAALSAVDQQLYEAAVIDGANKWQQTINVTLPSIAPTIIILFIMQIGHLLGVGYEKIMLLYNPAIYEKADVVSTYVYRRGLMNGDYSYSAAVGIFNSFINLTLLIISNSLSKRFSETSLW